MESAQKCCPKPRAKSCAKPYPKSVSYKFGNFTLFLMRHFAQSRAQNCAQNRAQKVPKMTPIFCIGKKTFQSHAQNHVDFLNRGLLFWAPTHDVWATLPGKFWAILGNDGRCRFWALLGCSQMDLGRLWNSPGGSWKIRAASGKFKEGLGEPWEKRWGIQSDRAFEIVSSHKEADLCNEIQQPFRCIFYNCF